MFRVFPYFLLFVATMLLQVFLFDNLSMGIYFNPLIYIAFILLLPLNTPPWLSLALGFFTGLVADSLSGGGGLNMVATLPVAFARPWMASFFCNRDDARDGGIPSPALFGSHKFVHYLVVGVLFHEVLFFMLESLSMEHLLQTFLRILLSGAASVLFIWIIARVFTSKIPTRV